MCVAPCVAPIGASDQAAGALVAATGACVGPEGARVEYPAVHGAPMEGVVAPADSYGGAEGACGEWPAVSVPNPARQSDLAQTPIWESIFGAGKSRVNLTETAGMGSHVSFV